MKKGKAMDGMLRGAGWRSHGRDGGDDRRRRIWPAAVRAAIVAESFAAGAKVSQVAARHGVNACMLSKWRGEAVAHGSACAPPSSTAPLGFVPVKLSTASGNKAEVLRGARPWSGTIEIVLGDANIRVPRGVDAVLLSRLLAAVRGRV
jgi:transposase